MNRPLAPLAVGLLALVVGACSSDEAPRSSPPPEPVAPAATPPPALPVHLALPEAPGPGVEDWAKALETAVAAGQGRLRLVDSPEAALVVVRIDAVEIGVKVEPEPPGEGEVKVMKGALVLGGSAQEFSLAYRGEAGPQAEALARNLRGIAADQAMKRSSPATAPGDAPEGKTAEGGGED